MMDFTGNALQELAEQRGLIVDPLVCERIIAAIDVGSHVALTGPPGTGKTTLAYLAAELGRSAVLCTGYEPVTATSSWDTDVTIGRYESTADGPLFQPGIFVQAIAAGRWLVIDELNRADLDQAFGPLFTVLAGQSVTLPFHHRDSERQISLVPFGAEAPPDTEVIAIPHSWRLLGTMNEVDRDLLHRLSYALMRRLAFIEVPSPSTEQIRALLERPGGEVVEPLLAVRSVRELGPAVFLDAARFSARRSEDGRSPSRTRLEALTSYVLPQLEGVDDLGARRLYEELAGAFDGEELRELGATIRSLTHHGPQVAPPPLLEPNAPAAVAPAAWSA